jgi:anti-sigma B factor antagonist
MEARRRPGDGDEGLWAITGEVDIVAAPQLQPVLREELDSGRDVVLDLSQVTFLDSTGLGVLLGATKRASARGLRFALCTNASEPVMQMVEVTGTREIFEWAFGGGDDGGAAGVREPRRPYPSGGSTSAEADGSSQSRP